jgi:integrase
MANRLAQETSPYLLQHKDNPVDWYPWGEEALRAPPARHAHAVELGREGVPLIVIQRQLGHRNLGITSVYLQGIDNAEITETVRARRQPMIPVSTSPPR